MVQNNCKKKEVSFGTPYLAPVPWIRVLRQMNVPTHYLFFPNKNGAQDPFKKVSFENLGELIILSGLATGWSARTGTDWKNGKLGQAEERENGFFRKHCQRHNGPEGWVQLTKVSQPRFNFITSANIFSSGKILTKLQLKNLAWTSITKSQLPNMQQTVANKVLIINISNSYNINTFWVGIFTKSFTTLRNCILNVTE